MMQLNAMIKTMKKDKLPEDIVHQFERVYQTYKGPEVKTYKGHEADLCFVEKMDECLTEEQCFSIWERNGGCRGMRHDEARKAFALEHADKPLAERVKLYTETFNPMDKLCLNDDNTLTVTFAHSNNGVHTGKYTCNCPTIKSLKQPFKVSPTFCGCAAGGRLYAYQLVFGIKLKLKSIDSSVLGSDGEKPCSFTYEVGDTCV